MAERTQHSFFSKFNETTVVFLLMFVLFLAELRNWNPACADNAYRYLKPIFQTIISVLIIGLALKKTNPSSATDNLNPKWYWLVFAGGFLVSFSYAFYALNAVPVAETSSDIVISIEAYVQRFLAGEAIYEPIVHNTHTVIPNYLSMMWMPFIPAELLNFDYRLMAFLIAVLGFFVYTKRAIKKDCNTAIKMLLVLSPWLVFFVVAKMQKSVLTHSIEWMIVGFYFILAYSIFSKNAILKGIGVGLVALSRFSFFTWGPFYVFTTYKSLGLRKTLIALGTLTTLILGLFVFPFFIKDTTILEKGNAYYETVMAREWQVHEWQEEDEVPFHLSRGDNFAVFFHSFQDGTPTDNLGFFI